MLGGIGEGETLIQPHILSSQKIGILNKNPYENLTSHL
jgi:hypothetical protein